MATLTCKYPILWRLDDLLFSFQLQSNCLYSHEIATHCSNKILDASIKSLFSTSDVLVARVSAGLLSEVTFREPPSATANTSLSRSTYCLYETVIKTRMSALGAWTKSTANFVKLHGHSLVRFFSDLIPRMFNYLLKYPPTLDYRNNIIPIPHPPLNRQLPHRHQS